MSTLLGRAFLRSPAFSFVLIPAAFISLSLEMNISFIKDMERLALDLQYCTLFSSRE